MLNHELRHTNMRKSIFFSSLLRQRNPYFVRSLFHTAERHNYEREIVIRNNSALFTKLASIDQQKSGDHQNVTLYCPRFQLDDVHSSHLQHSWAQNIYGSPWYVCKLFLEVHSRYLEDKFIIWQLFNELRQIALEKLQKKGVQVLNETPKIHRDDAELQLTTKAGITLRFDVRDTFLYNWYKIPRTHQIEGLIQRSNTDLYKIDPMHLPSTIIILGYSLSAVWLKKHFSMINLFYLNRKTDILPKIISNYGVPYHQIEANTFNLEDIQVNLSSDQAKLQITIPDRESTIVSDFNSALGIRLMTELTDNVVRQDRQLIVSEYHFTY